MSRFKIWGIPLLVLVFLVGILLVSNCNGPPKSDVYVCKYIASGQAQVIVMQCSIFRKTAG